VIRREQAGVLATIVLDRPDKRNALTPEMMSLLGAAIAAIPSSARALMLRGEGPVFCGGFDLQMCLDHPGTLEALLRGLAAAIQALRALPIPVVGAAHGAAIAGGCALLGGCDVIITDHRARLGYPVTPLGFSPAVSAPYLRLLSGNGPARERLLDPGLISGGEAVRIGLAHESFLTPQAALARAREIALQLAEKPAAALAATRAWLAEIESALAPPDAPSRGLRTSLALAGSPEERERLSRFLTKGSAP
jgi:enoyl-CoA hydratase/carnithine racemase